MSQSDIFEELVKLHGPLITGAELAKVLGHKSMASLRQAKVRRQVPVKLIKIPHRKGLFALTEDVANWLASLKAKGD